MPTQPTALNFIRGLSDFWVRFFESTEIVEGLFGAAQVQYGQLYLELMEATLGTSLQHMPIFQKKYWRYLGIREDLLSYVEGASPALNRYEVLSTDRFADANLLVNRIIDPTAVLKKTVDFDVVNGAVRLAVNPFVTNPGFPSRAVTVVTPSDLTHPFGTDWTTLGLGVQPGDTLRIRYNSGSDHDVPIAAVQGASLILQESSETTKADGLARSVNLAVFRTPYDSKQRGATIDGRISEIRLFGLFGAVGATVTGLVDSVEADVTAVNFGATLVASNADPSWVGKKISLMDDATPSNNGIYTITVVTGTTVTVAAAAFFTSSGAYFAFVGSSPSGTDVGTYIYMNDPVDPTARVFARVISVGGNTLTLDTPLSLTPGTRVAPTRQVAVPDSTTKQPTVQTARPYIVPGTFQALPVRLFDHTVGTETYTAGGALIDGIDYLIDYESGTLTMLSVWAPEPEFRANYEYRLLVCALGVTYRGTWQALVPYVTGDSVVSSGKTWIATAGSTGVTPGTSAVWRELPYLFRFDQAFNFRELGVWVPDALLDIDALYTNFGYLLSFQKPGSEQYRAFLRGVAQLFLRGPSLARFTSAFNVMAYLPVVREDGEVLRSFTSGFEALGASALEAETGDTRLGNFGELLDFTYGSSGSVTVSGSTFTTIDPTYMGVWDALLTYAKDDTVTFGIIRYRALGVPTVGTFIPTEWLELLPTFLSSDLGGIITARKPGGDAFTYTISSVSADGETAVVSPVPPADATDLLWQFSHVLVRKRFTVRGPNVTFAFTADDVGSIVFLEGSSEQRNRGAFRVAEVEGPRTAYLEADFSLVDETGLKFRVSRTRETAIETDKNLYTIPVNIPIRRDVMDPAKVGVLTFKAFEALTTAITISDYVSDESWWHNITIPQEVVQLYPDNLARRQVSPQLIEHVISALDEAVVGDFGIAVGRDDEGERGIDRIGPARWLGGQWLRLLFDPAVPPARTQDVGQYIHIPDAPFAGYYKILDIAHDGVSVKLDRFPPREASTRVAPVDFAEVTLPPILHRRTVGFVLMDRFLKYHAIRVKINAPEIFTGSFITDALTLIKEAKPSHTYVYLEPLTDFVDYVRVKEVFEVAYGPWLDELISYSAFVMRVGSEIRVGEYFAYFDEAVTVVLPGGANVITVVPTLPYVPDRSFLMFVRFTAGTSGGRPLTEGMTYSVNYATKQITIPNLDAGSVTYNIITLALRVPSSPSPSPWWTGVNSSNAGAIWWGETPWHVGGTDPLIREPSGIIQPYGQALTEPPLQLLIS